PHPRRSARNCHIGSPSKQCLEFDLDVAVGAFCSRLYKCGKLSKHAGGKFWWNWLPMLFSGGQFFFADVKVDSAVGNINANSVAVLHQSDWSTNGSLRCNMANAQPGGTTGETAIGQQQNIGPKTSTFNCPGN